MGERDEVCESFAIELQELFSNSKPLINMLTMLAEENRAQAAQLVSIIETHLNQVSAEKKLPTLYLMDSIIKNVGKTYAPLFTPNLVKNFKHTFDAVNEETRELMFKLRQTWSEILPKKILHHIDKAVHESDPAWPVSQPGGTYSKTSVNASRQQSPVLPPEKRQRPSRIDKLQKFSVELTEKKRRCLEAKIQRCQLEIEGLQQNNPTALKNLAEIDKEIESLEYDVKILEKALKPEKIECEAAIAEDAPKMMSTENVAVPVVSPPKDPRLARRREVAEEVIRPPQALSPVSPLSSPSDTESFAGPNSVIPRKSSVVPKELQNRRQVHPPPDGAASPIMADRSRLKADARRVPRIPGQGLLPTPTATNQPSVEVKPAQPPPVRENVVQKKPESAKKILDTKKIDQKLLSKKDRNVLPRIPKVPREQPLPTGSRRRPAPNSLLRSDGIPEKKVAQMQETGLVHAETSLSDVDLRDFTAPATAMEPQASHHNVGVKIDSKTVENPVSIGNGPLTVQKPKFDELEGLFGSEDTDLRQMAVQPPVANVAVTPQVLPVVQMGIPNVAVIPAAPNSLSVGLSWPSGSLPPPLPPPPAPWAAFKPIQDFRPTRLPMDSRCPFPGATLDKQRFNMTEGGGDVFHDRWGGSGNFRREIPPVVDTRFTNNEDLKAQLRVTDSAALRVDSERNGSSSSMSMTEKKSVNPVEELEFGRKSVIEGKRKDDDDDGEYDPKSFTMRCMRCNSEGHIYRDCPKSVRTDIMKCSECGERGHREPNCPVKLKAIAEAATKYCVEDPKRLSIDGILRDIRLCGRNIIAFFGNEEPRDLFFRTDDDSGDDGMRTVVIDETLRVDCRIGGPAVDFRLPGGSGAQHSVQIAGPLREIVLDGVGYGCFFGGEGVSIELDGVRRPVRIEGNPPIVAVGDRKRTDVVIARITMFVRDEETPLCPRHPIPVCADGFPQQLRVRGQPVTLQFVNKMLGFRWNGRVYETRFEDEGETTVLMETGRPVHVRFSRLPLGFVAGAVDLVGLEEADVGSVQLQQLPSSGNFADHLLALVLELREMMGLPGLQKQPVADLLSFFQPAPKDSVKASTGRPPNVQSLLSKLQEHGLLPATTGSIAKNGAMSVAKSIPIKDPTTVKEDNASVGEKMVEIEDDLAPINVLFSNERLRRRDKAVISTLSFGLQCKTCGFRFHSGVSNRYGAHLDWHFRQNKIKKQSKKRAESHPWCYQFSDWLKFERVDDSDEWNDDGQGLAGDADVDEIPSIALSELGAEKEPSCSACFEHFQSVYDRELEDYVVRPAVFHNGKLFHPLCLEDYIKRADDHVDVKETTEFKESEAVKQPAVEEVELDVHSVKVVSGELIPSSDAETGVEDAKTEAPESEVDNDDITEIPVPVVVHPVVTVTESDAEMDTSNKKDEADVVVFTEPVQVPVSPPGLTAIPVEEEAVVPVQEEAPLPIPDTPAEVEVPEIAVPVVEDQEMEEKEAEEDEEDDDIIMEEPPEKHYDVLTIEESDEEMDDADATGPRKPSSAEEIIETRVVYRNVVELEPEAVMDKFDFPIDPATVKQEPLDKDEISRLNSIIHAKFASSIDEGDDDITEVPAATVAAASLTGTSESLAPAPRIRINLAKSAAAPSPSSKPNSPEPPPGLVNKELTVFPPVEKGLKATPSHAEPVSAINSTVPDRVAVESSGDLRQRFDSPVEFTWHQGRFLNRNYRWDNQRLYKIHEFVHVGERFQSWVADSPQKRVVTLATHSSPDRLHWASVQAAQWNGPISLAIFVPGFEFVHMTLILEYLFHCYPEFAEKSAINLVYPASSPPMEATVKEVKTFSSKLGSPDCELAPPTKFAARLKAAVASVMIGRDQGKPSHYRSLPVPYPQNHLRNVARKTAPFEHVMLLDIDVVPSAGSCESLAEFFASEPTRAAVGVHPVKTVFILPTYELSERLKQVPRTKAELLQLVSKKLAQPYHIQVFQPNQFATNFSLWERDLTTASVGISHEVVDPPFFYEPFYVSKDIVPVHDERYIGYGFTRNTQVLETKLAGFKFFVLTPVFTCHWGLYKDRRSAKRPAWRERQNNMNNKLFQQAKKELSVKYGVKL
ncbi:unnamed protein product [Notodromas monacha]|uniref:Uncharacterized protein n=1 Tax=Notodromas monacha TaxID=399045 RepID=A0A7R9GDG2_9CRUS|nr:unnamed protein product [Notodromas monacha]CAG0916936.1 unnamed protein product [Notodromas monacha]